MIKNLGTTVTDLGGTAAIQQVLLVDSAVLSVTAHLNENMVSVPFSMSAGDKVEQMPVCGWALFA